MKTIPRPIQLWPLSRATRKVNTRPFQLAMAVRCASTNAMSNATTKPPIAIIGAGPAGLTLARLLDMSRIPYTIFERDETPETRQGSGTLDVRPATGQLALEAAGLLDQFNATARHGVDTTIVNDQGKVLLCAGGKDDKERPEIDRQDLQRILQNSVPLEKIQWGSKIEQITRSSDSSVAIHMANNKVESGFRLVVGADGSWSKVRRGLFTSEAPVYSGITFFTTYIKPEDSIYPAAASLAKQGNYLAMAGTQKIFLHYLGDKSYFFSVGLQVSETWAEDKTILKDALVLWERLLAEPFESWTSNLTDLVKQSRGDFRPWPLYNGHAPSWEPIPGATLVGDAAHLTVPTGDGVNNAMFDSYELAKQITKHGVDNLDQAVVDYEATMIPRAIAAIQKGQFVTKALFGPEAPGSFFQAMGVKLEEN